jgi:hypothetical protein
MKTAVFFVSDSEFRVIGLPQAEIVETIQENAGTS